MIERPLGILLSFLVIACSDGGTGPEPPPGGPSALRITPEAPALRLGESMTLDVTFVDASNRPVDGTAAVTWSSSAADIVSVDSDGVIAARAFGNASITARAGRLSASANVTVRTPAAETGDNAPVSAVIDTTGGTITAASADGIRYTLSVPRHALATATTITLTPVASIGDFPAASGVSAAVQFEPAGLTFTVPAELTIVAPVAFATPTIAFSQTGTAFTLAPAVVHGDTARIMVGHFSSAGTTAPTPEETAALASSGGDAETNARHGVAQELNSAAAAGKHPDPAAIAEHLKDWFEHGVLPALEAAIAGTTDTEAALSQWMRWWSEAELWAHGLLEAEIDQARTLALAALRTEIARLNARCAAQNEPALVRDILHFAGLAALLGFDEVDPSLELSAIFAELCMQIVIHAAMPDPFVAGSTLEVRAGVSIGGRAAGYDVPLDIRLSSSTATFSRPEGTTDGSGRFTSDVTLRPGSAEIVVDVEAVHPDMARMRATHRVTASLGAGRLEISQVVQGWSLFAIARSGGGFDNERGDVRQEWTYEPGRVAASDSMSFTHGPSSAAGGLEYDSNVEIGGAAMLAVQSSGTMTASASGSTDRSAGSNGDVGAHVDTWVEFHVHDAPVYYEIRAAGSHTGPNPGVFVFLGRRVNGRFSDIHRWTWNADTDSGPSRLATGWLDPGEYRFEAYGYASAIAGWRVFERPPSVEAVSAYTASFRVLEKEP